MALIQWSNVLSVGVAEIDKQHQMLVSVINELYHAMKQRKAKDSLDNIINHLVSYTKIHFETEERYFDLYRYPKAESHKKEHASFVIKVTEFKEMLNNGKIALSIDVMNYLSDWLNHHIKATDKQYTGFFNEKGLK